jgi:hypothetical protein
MRNASKWWMLSGAVALVAGALALGPAAQAAGGTITVVRNDSTVDGYTADFGGGEFGVAQFTGMPLPAQGANVAVAGNVFQTYCLEGNEHIPTGVGNWTLDTAAHAGGNGGQTSPGADPLSPETAYLFSRFWNGNLPGFDYLPLGGADPSVSYGVNRRSSASDLQAAIWYLEDEWLGSNVSGPGGHLGWNFLTPRAQGWVNDAFVQTAPGGTWSAAWGAGSIGNVGVLVVTNADGSNAQDVLVLTTPEDEGCVVASQIKSEFNGTAILAGDCIWFNSHFKLKGVGSNLVTVQVTDINVSSSEFDLDLPDALVTFNPSATTATTTFNAVLNRWETTVPSNYTSNVFMSGGFLHLPTGLKGGVKNVYWSATFHIVTPVPVSLSWQWSAAAYESAACDVPYADLCVKPVDSNTLSAYHNSDHAGTPECVKSYVTGGARGGGGSNFTGSWSGTASFNCE